MRKTKALISTGRAFFMICIMHLFFSLGTDTAEAADQTILSQMQSVSSPLTGVPVVQAASPEKSSWKGRMQAGVRSRAILLNPQIQNKKPLPQGTNLVTNLFDDINIESNVLRSTRNTNGVTVTTAKITGSQWGRVFIASSNGQVRAKILAPDQGKIFSIEYNNADGLHYALEMDPQLLQFDEEDIIQPDEGLLIKGEESIYQMMNNLPIEDDESIDATTVIDVMVVYSNDAVAYAGSVEEVNNIIALGMAMANDAHDNTNTGLYLNLIHSEQINYTGSGNRETDLNRLSNSSDGYIDNVHTLRDTYGADFVSLMLGDYSSDGGTGYLLTSSSGNSAQAFNVITGPAFDSYTPVHEIGHNMGLSHAKDQNYQAGPTAWSPDPYSFGNSSAGWHWHPVANQNGYSSIMAYTGGTYYSDGLGHTRVGLFSDPNISYEGFPSGHIGDGYNALVLRTLKNVYGGYRDRPISANSIVLDSPNGGESWNTGDTQFIQWDSNGVSGNVKIELLKNGSLNQVIAADTLNDRLYSWTLPTGLNGKDYTVRISSLNGSITDTSDAVFTIKSIIDSHSMDTDPGYSMDSGWEFGEPFGDNATYGGAASAHTGTNVYDTNLDGAMFATGYLTSTAFDCSDYEDVQLSFMGWFSVLSGYTATVEVSTDNINWQSIYSVSEVWETGWKEYTFDISNYADGQSTVYVRWGHVANSGGSNYSGMSVDDVKIIGVEKATVVAPTTGNIVPVLFMLLSK